MKEVLVDYDGQEDAMAAITMKLESISVSSLLRLLESQQKIVESQQATIKILMSDARVQTNFATKEGFQLIS